VTALTQEQRNQNGDARQAAEKKTSTPEPPKEKVNIRRYANTENGKKRGNLLRRARKEKGGRHSGIAILSTTKKKG